MYGGIYKIAFYVRNYVLRRYYNEYKQNISKISIKTKGKKETKKRRTCEKKSIVQLTAFESTES